MQTLIRRSRMRRTRTGKRIELTPRDIEIFKLLGQYRYLRSTYIHEFVGGRSGTRFKERLGDLFHESYLDRPAEQWRFADCRHLPVVHELGAGARHVLAETGTGTLDQRTWLRSDPHRQFEHSLMVCEVLASIELATRERPDLRFIPWPEIRGRAPEATRSSTAPFRLPVLSGGHLVPDGLFGIEYTAGGKKTYRFFALEADRGTMPVSRSKGGQTSFLGKIAAYREVIARQVHKTHLGIPNLLVLTVTGSIAHAREIIGRLEGGGESAAFLFQAPALPNPRTPMRQLLGEPWQRAGHPPLCIGESD